MNTEHPDKIELTPEQLEQLHKTFHELVKTVKIILDTLCEAVQKATEMIRQIAIELARFYLKQQLLEWKVPHPVADWIARNIYWFWAVRLGYDWFQRKLLPAES